MFYRLLQLIIKELQTIFGNAQGRIILVFPVIIQTLLFPFAATLEVKNNTLMVYNQDSGAASVELINRMSKMAAFTHIVTVYSDRELQQNLDAQKALLAVHFPANFSRNIMSRQSAPVQIIIDGRRSNSGQIATNYVLQVINTYAAEHGGRTPTKLSVRNMYNPNLIYRWHILPCLVAIITTVGCLIVTALSIAREREEGTFDQLLVSPLTPAYIMLGKAIPGILIAFMQGSFIAFAARFFYGVPFTGSLPLLLVGMLFYGLSLAGVGLFISSICSTQQQAFLGVFSFMVPAVMLSGYVAPVENMPVFLQLVSHIDPLTYFIRILKGVFLKDFGFADALPNLWPMLLIALCTVSLALLKFRRHIA
jgi:ABC-2 type transport system permease protein